jgi:anti-sigma factor RsiW
MSETGEITCRELVELVTSYLEGALPERERVLFEQHLVICRGCSTHLDQVRVTQRALRGVATARIDPDARARLLDAFREWKSE